MSAPRPGEFGKTLEVYARPFGTFVVFEPAGGIGAESFYNGRWILETADRGLAERVCSDLNALNGRDLAALRELEEAAAIVAEGGLEFSDPRVGYECWQIDRGGMDRLRAALKAFRVEL